ncbi:MAG: FAD-dependent oxidoreductase, partial [bacterium]|nr:FAD-dependent oxidoreductase [bacterium]
MDPEFQKHIKDLPLVIATKDMSWNKTGSWSLMKPEFMTKTPPCQGGCPADVPVRDIMSAVRQKDIDKAVGLFMEAHPFPSITGRVCHHPCQTNCLRKDVDGALEIRAIERFISDQAPGPQNSGLNRDEKIAVIGSGPSGLACAYYLRIRGYKVTVFESSSVPGGLLRFGIPGYRLPEDILDKEIKRLERMGVEFRVDTTVTAKFIGTELSDHDAVFLGIGAHLSKKMMIPGEDLENVLPGLKFLINFENFRDKFINKKVAVIGGGNTAMDAARTALRLGADVDIIYRRTREEMPAIPEEIDGAVEEGCNFEFLAAPEEIMEHGDRLKVKIIRMKLGEPDDSGRRRPEKIPGSQYDGTYNYVVSAIGEDPDFKDFGGKLTIENKSVKIDRSGQTVKSDHYAGGDAAGYSRTVVDAIASGKRAASAIDSMLKGEENEDPETLSSDLTEDNINTAYFDNNSPVEIRSIDPDSRKER